MSWWADSGNECFKTWVLLENDWIFAHVCIVWSSHLWVKRNVVNCMTDLYPPLTVRRFALLQSEEAQGWLRCLHVQRRPRSTSSAQGPLLLHSQWHLLLPSRRLDLNFLWALITAGNSFPLPFPCHPQPPKRQDERECHCSSLLLWLWFPPLSLCFWNFKASK